MKNIEVLNFCIMCGLLVVGEGGIMLEATYDDIYGKKRGWILRKARWTGLVTVKGRTVESLHIKICRL